MFAADAVHPNKSLQEKLAYIFTLKRTGRIDLSIRPEYYELLARLGNPHCTAPPVIHVAGTNGKGSTIAFMRAILEAARYRVHTYTSPHLLRFNERIVLAGREIGDRALEELLDETLEKNAGMPQTFFEITTALAFAAFARTPADILLLETGLGGRLDSTNVIARPLATIITALSYDHTEFLGTSLASIAAEKAGIIKNKIPCIVAAQAYGETLPVLREKAALRQAPLFCENDGWSVTRPSGGQAFFSVTAGGKTLENLPALSLPGAHQIGNAATAVAALLIQETFAIPGNAFRTGLQAACWPARLQRMRDIALPAGWELWLDGGHNDGAAAVLADQARTWAEQDGRPLHIITGMMAHKDAAGFAAPLAKLCASVTCVFMENGYAPAALELLWALAGAKNAAVSTLDAALIDRIAQSGPGGRILVTGSLYLAGPLAACRN